MQMTTNRRRDKFHSQVPSLRPRRCRRAAVGFHEKSCDVRTMVLFGHVLLRISFFYVVVLSGIDWRDT